MIESRLSPQPNPSAGHDSSVASTIIAAATGSGGSTTVASNNEEIVRVLGYEGVLLNRDEIANFRGPISIDEYPINQDPNPLIIHKTCNKQHHATQEISVRYLEPPPQPPPGDIIIQQEPGIVPPSAPPIIIRTKPEKSSSSKEDIVIREAPPKISVPIERKIIKLAPAKVAPPPRKVIIEKPPSVIADKSQSIVVERWLAPKTQPRRVVYEGGPHAFKGHPPVRNEIHVCEYPNLSVDKKFIDMGINRVNPNEYISKYHGTLIESSKLPDVAREVRAPSGYVLASDQLVPSLVGDVQMLQYVDLEREGLTAYASIIKESISSTNTNTTTGHATTSTTNQTTSQGTHQQNQHHHHHHHHHHGEENVQHHTSKTNTLGHLVKWNSGSGGEHANVSTGSSNIANIIHESNQMNQTSSSTHGLGLLASWRVNEQTQQQTGTAHTSSHHANTNLAQSSTYNRETASSTHGNQGFQSSWTSSNDKTSNQTGGQTATVMTNTQHKDKSSGDQTLTYIASWKARENVPQQQQQPERSTITNVARESTTQNVSRVEEARVESLPIKTNPTTSGHKIQTVRESSSSSSRSSRSSSHMHGTRYRVESVRDRTHQHGQSKCCCNCRERNNAVASSSGGGSSGGCHHKPQVYEIECKSHGCRNCCSCCCHHTVHVKTSISFDRVYNF